MLLAIDQGNTNCKAALFNDKGVILHRYEGHDAIYTLLNDPEIAEVWISNTGEPFRSEKKIKSVRKVKLPFENAYKTPETLGDDRIAAAAFLQKSISGSHGLAIHAGTALTFNYFSKGKFIGGSISPGLMMRFKALHEFTSGLPYILPISETENFIGTDTSTSILAGVQTGILEEIKGMISRYETESGNDFEVYLTGGDVSCFERQLKKRIFVEPDLVLKGIFYLADYNKTL